MANERVAQSYEVEIEAAKERLNQSLAAAAADVVVLAERFGKSIHAVAKDVTADQPELFNSIKARSSRMEKTRSGAESGGSSRQQTAKSNLNYGLRHADPEDIESAVSDPAVRRKLETAMRHQDEREASERIHKAEQRRSSDGMGRQLGERVALHDLQSAVNRFNKTVADLLPEVGDVPESERFWLRGEADRLGETADELRYMADKGKTRLDAGIDSVLSEGTA